MSFIDKALEKAKALNLKKGKTAALEGLAKPVSPSTPGAGGGREPGVIPSEICYSAPRQVTVDPEKLRRHRLIAGGWETESAVAERYKVLRTHVLQLTSEQGHNTLMVTGALPGEGKSLTSINLAISISLELNHTVLLVDADLRSPSIGHYFGLPDAPGLTDHLADGVPLNDLLVHPQGLAELVILPAGRRVTQAAELLNSPSMHNLVQELKHCYPNRYVIFDLPPLLVFADALAFAPLVDGVIVVVEARKTPKESIERCKEMLKKVRLLGFVLNKAEETFNTDYYRSYYEPPKTFPSAKRRFKLPLFKK